MKKTLFFIIGFVLLFPTFAFAQQYVTESKVTTRVGNPPSTSTPGSFVYYCQHDPKWNTCAMSSSGCGPTTMAMILTYFGDTIDPVQSANIFEKNGWRSCTSAAASNMFGAIAALKDGKFDNIKGYTALQLTYNKRLDLQKANDYLTQGYLIIGSTPNHIFVIDGVDVANDTIQKRDPDDGCNSSEGKVIKPNSTPWRGEGWFYAYAIKKVEQGATP